MKPKKQSPTFMAVLAGACWAAAVFVFAGGVFQEDTTARVLFGLVWVLTGVWWLVQFNRSRTRTGGTATLDPGGSPTSSGSRTPPP